jgi:hypothetical protein
MAYIFCVWGGGTKEIRGQSQKLGRRKRRAAEVQKDGAAGYTCLPSLISLRQLCPLIQPEGTSP